MESMILYEKLKDKELKQIKTFQNKYEDNNV